MGIGTEDKYLVKSFRESKKYGAKRLLKLFANKNWSLDGLKALIKNLTTHVGYCADSVRSTTKQYVEPQYLCCHFFDQRFQSTKTRFC